MAFSSSFFPMHFAPKKPATATEKKRSQLGYLGGLSLRMRLEHLGTSAESDIVAARRGGSCGRGVFGIGPSSLGRRPNSRKHNPHEAAPVPPASIQARLTKAQTWGPRRSGSSADPF